MMMMGLVASCVMIWVLAKIVQFGFQGSRQMGLLYYSNECQCFNAICLPILWQ